MRTAANQGLDIIALTDHNSVAGWVRIKHELEDLVYLEQLGRITPPERELLAEYRELMDKILVLPGFEFTATFGFHILAIFPPATTTRLMEHLLLLLGVPEDRIGSGEVGATSDVLRAYEVLNDHGAIVIGAHVNSTHGVAMRNIRFGGQTKIAYTQDTHLHALEVTDLTSTSQRSTARFFSGSKAEYPRRMHCIQGSDAHRLQQDPQRTTNLGIGDRVTEFQLPERTFAALKAVLASSDWERVRAARSGGPEAVAVHAARETGPDNRIAFHERITSGSKSNLAAIVRDIAAMANTEGGDVLIGVGQAGRRTVPGIADPTAVRADLTAAVAEQIEPKLEVTIRDVGYEGKTILTVETPKGPEPPYALASGEIPIRRGGESAPARRDEVIRLVRGESIATVAATTSPDTPAPPRNEPGRGRRESPRSNRVVEEEPRVAPRNGVEIVEAIDQDGAMHYTMRDLRSDQVTRNVTPATARSLWAQAIREFERNAPTEDRIAWKGDIGYWKSTRISSGEKRYHLAARANDGRVRIFFGVSEDGLDERWKAVIPVQQHRGQGTDAAPDE